MNVSKPLIVALPTAHITQQLLHDMTQHNTHDIALEQVVSAIIDAGTMDLQAGNGKSWQYLGLFFEPYLENEGDYEELHRVIMSRVTMFTELVRSNPNIPKEYWGSTSFELISITPDGDWIIGSV